MDLQITSTDGAYDALMEKGADKPACPACDQRIWTLIEKPIGFRDGGGDSFRTIALTCNRCGYLRFHVAKTLLAKL